MTNRPQPVRIMAVVLAVISFAAASAQLADLISATAMAWLVIANGALTVGWGAWTASQVTPLANPQDNQGRTLVPVNSGSSGNVTPPRDQFGYALPRNALAVLLIALLIVSMLVLFAPPLLS